MPYLFTITMLSAIGLLLSIYALYIEIKLSRNKKYKPLCDLSDKISCSKNFTSKDAAALLIPNSLFGIFFYIAISTLSYLKQVNYIFYLSIPAFIFTLYLAYSSFIKLRNFCIVCTFVYAINILILLLSFLSI